MHLAAALKVVLAFVAWIWVIVLIPLVPQAAGSAERRGIHARCSASTKRRSRRCSETEAVYKSLIESLPLNVFRKDLQGRFVDANQRFCDTLGKPLAAILGKTRRRFLSGRASARSTAATTCT